jgi:predicted TIM-barrel fold metal-dependent hydrolase
VNLSKDKDYVERKLDEIERLKLRGVKLCPHTQFFNPSECDNAYLLFEYCRATGSFVLSHSGCGAGPFELPQLSWNSHPGLWEPLVRDYPDVPLVLAHFGSYSTREPGIWLYDALQLGEKYGNVYADLAAVHTILDVEEVVREIRATIGFDRVLFASDYPLPIYQDQTLRDVVMHVALNPMLSGEEKSAVLGGNAARLLGRDAIPLSGP